MMKAEDLVREIEASLLAQNEAMAFSQSFDGTLRVHLEKAFVPRSHGEELLARLEALILPDATVE